MLKFCSALPLLVAGTLLLVRLVFSHGWFRVLLVWVAGLGAIGVRLAGGKWGRAGGKGLGVA